MYAQPSAETRLPRPKRGKRDVSRFRLPGHVAQAAKGKKPPQAVFKVISHARGHRAKVLLNYVARSGTDNPLPMEDEAGRLIEGQEAIEAVYQEWAQQFERATPGQKRPPRHVTHTIFSADCAQTPANARAVQAAVADVMREQLGANYRYMMVLHTDNKRPHVHVVINNYNQVPDGPKLQLNPPDLMAMRQQFAQKLRERGIEQHAHPREDRIAILEAIAEGTEALRTAGSWYERKLYTAALANPLAPGAGIGEGGAGLSPDQVEATPKMLEYARTIEAETGVELEGTDFESVRNYLDANSKTRLGLETWGQDRGRVEGDGVEGVEVDRDSQTVEVASPFDAFAKRRDMAKSVARLKEAVKAATLPFSQERREKMAILRKLSLELIDPAAPNYRGLVEDLGLKLAKDRERVKDYIRALTDPAAAIQDRAQRKQRDAAIGRIIERNIEAVKQARADLIRSPGVGLIEGYRLGAQLKTYERELRRIALLRAVGLHDKAAPGTAAEVAAERSQAKVIERATRTADKLEALGPWYEPTPRTGRDGKPQKERKAFDAFAKRRALTNIATHLADRLEGAGVPADHPLAVRVAGLQAAQIAAPAPDYGKLVDRLKLTVQDARMRADFEARRAAHASTPAEDREQIRGDVRKALIAKADALRLARREIAEAPGLSDRERAGLGHQLKRAQLIATQASRLTHKPAALATKLAALARITAAPIEPAPTPSIAPRSIDYDHNPYAAHYGLRDTPATAWREPYPEPSAGELFPAGPADGVRALPGGSLDVAGPPEHRPVEPAAPGHEGPRPDAAMLVPHNAAPLLEYPAPDAAQGLRRDAPGAGPAEGRPGSHAEAAGAPLDQAAATPTERFARLLDRLQVQLEAAGRWDDPAPYQSPYREGKPRSAPELDAFGKQRAMLSDIDRLKVEIDSGRIDFTPAMRRQLAGIREQRYDIEKAAPRDIEEVVSRLAQKVTDDQLRFMRQTDTPAATVTETVQRQRQVTRAAERVLQSVESARKAVETQKGLTIAQRAALTKRLADMQRAMAMYAGRGRGMGMS